MSKVKNKVYCEGCKYVGVGYRCCHIDGMEEVSICCHPKNETLLDTAKQSHVVHPLLNQANPKNNCKLKEEGKSFAEKASEKLWLQIIQVIGVVLLISVIVVCFFGGK